MAQYTASYTHSGATGTYTLTLTLGQSNRNIAANTSDITYSLVLSVTGSGFGSYDTGGALTVYSDAAGANIVNESYSARASCNSSSPLTLFSGSVTGAAHNTDGTLNLTLNASAYRTGSNPYFNQTLSIANKLFEAEANQRGTARIKSDGEWKSAIPYIRVDGVWRQATCHIKSDGEWKTCG